MALTAEPRAPSPTHTTALDQERQAKRQTGSDCFTVRFGASHGKSCFMHALCILREGICPRGGSPRGSGPWNERHPQGTAP